MKSRERGACSDCEYGMKMCRADERPLLRFSRPTLVNWRAVTSSRPQLSVRPG